MVDGRRASLAPTKIMLTSVPLLRAKLIANLALLFLALSSCSVGTYVHRCNAFSSHILSSKSMFRYQANPLDSHTFRERRLEPKTLSMGLEVKIRIVGRKSGGEKWLESSYTTYETRLKSTNLQVTTQWHKNDDELIKGTDGDASKNHGVVLLDPLGKMVTSEKFSEDMYQWLEEGGSRLTFVIGGADGLPQEMKQTYGSRMLSLSSLTFTHQFARILLIEQIYRASEIKKGSGYHK